MPNEHPRVWGPSSCDTRSAQRSTGTWLRLPGYVHLLQDPRLLLPCGGRGCEHWSDSPRHLQTHYFARGRRTSTITAGQLCERLGMSVA